MGKRSPARTLLGCRATPTTGGYVPTGWARRKVIRAQGQAVVTDRLGSVRAGGSPATRYFPYGEEQQTTAQDRDKFATYYRDSSTGLDYADQRYYGSTVGRFLTADPYQASGGPRDPGSWNRYAYVLSDPVNLTDPSGLKAQDCVWISGSEDGIGGYWLCGVGGVTTVSGVHP